MSELSFPRQRFAGVPGRGPGGQAYNASYRALFLESYLLHYQIVCPILLPHNIYIFIGYQATFLYLLFISHRYGFAMAKPAATPIIISTLFPVLAILAVAGRFQARRLGKISRKLDDWVALVALVSAEFLEAKFEILNIFVDRMHLYCSYTYFR